MQKNERPDNDVDEHQSAGLKDEWNEITDIFSYDPNVDERILDTRQWLFSRK